MEIKVNDYVRTKEGYICKILKLNEPRYDDGYLDFNDIDSPRIYKPNVVKSSANKIDLIKKKDIVVDYDDNIYQVIKVFKDYVFTNKKNKYGQVITLVDYQIKSIVTKEMFEQMEYKID